MPKAQKVIRQINYLIGKMEAYPIGPPINVAYRKGYIRGLVDLKLWLSGYSLDRLADPTPLPYEARHSISPIGGNVTWPTMTPKGAKK